MQYVYSIALLVALLLSQTLRADDHGTNYDGIDLTVLGGMQYEVCQLRSGKTLEDADKQVKSAAKEFARLKLGLGIINFTPFLIMPTPITKQPTTSPWSADPSLHSQKAGIDWNNPAKRPK